jgi:hypothetical protein
MAATIITKKDLQESGKNLLNQIRGLMGQSLEEPQKMVKDLTGKAPFKNRR